MSKESFDTRIKPMIPFISTLVRRYSANSNLHLDHVQECLIKIWQDLDSFDPTRGDIKTWLAMVCRGKVRDLYRQMNSRKKQRLVMLTNQETEIPYFDHEQADTLHFPTLSPELRLVLRGNTMRAIAEAQGIPIPTVKSRLSRERLRLKEKTHV